jgi:uncharacterized DUF497 family protein
VKVDWDPQKAANNKRKHGISFHEAVTCFADPSGLLLDDAAHPERLVLIAVSGEVACALHGVCRAEADVIRIVPARKATAHERRRYEEQDE